MLSYNQSYYNNYKIIVIDNGYNVSNYNLFINLDKLIGSPKPGCLGIIVFKFDVKCYSNRRLIVFL